MNYLQLVKAIDLASEQLLGRAAAVNPSLVLRNWLSWRRTKSSALISTRI
jgi:hypothetical protein